MSVRYRLSDDPGHPFSEAVGVVRSVTSDAGGTRVSILSRRGRSTWVPAADVLAAKVWPL